MNLAKKFSAQTKHFNLSLGRPFMVFKWPLSSECAQRPPKQNKNPQQNHLTMMHRDLSFYPNRPYHARFPEATLPGRETLTYLDTDSNRTPLNSKAVIKTKAPATNNLKSNRPQTTKTEANNTNIKTNPCCKNISTWNAAQDKYHKAIRDFQTCHSSISTKEPAWQTTKLELCQLKPNEQKLNLKTKMQLMKDAKSKLLYLLPTRRKDIKQ